MLGLLSDGWNSLYRYFLNNFYDGFRQVTICCFFVFVGTNLLFVNVCVLFGLLCLML